MKLRNLLFIFLLAGFIPQAGQAQVCNACFVATPDTNSIGTMYLDASCSTPGFSGQVLYDWYADGIPYMIVPFPYFQISFASPGSHLIELIITDTGTGCTDTTSQTVVVPYSCSAQYSTSQSGTFTYFYSNVMSTTASAFWDFGDGTTSNSPYPVHQYPASGSYNACLTVTDTAFGGCVSTFCDSITVGGSNFCYAYYNVYNNGGGQNNYTADASFSNYSSSNYSFVWFLNGAIIQQGQNPICSFVLNQPFVNTITLGVADSNGIICDSSSQYLYAGGSTGNCFSCFYYTPVNVTGDSIWFDAACASIPPGGSLQWSLNGNILGVSSSSFTQFFQTPGTYNMTLFTKDSNGVACDSMYQFVYIAPPPCNACISVSQQSGSSSDYLFDASCYGTGNYSYSWLVNNNFVATTSNPQFNYSFTQSGSYDICVSITDVNSQSTCTPACTTIVVNTPTASLFDLCGTIYKANTNFLYSTAGQGEAMVYLVTLASGGQLTAIDSTLTNAYGQYCFNDKPIFDYRVKVALKPISPDYAVNIPSYFQSATMWYDANVITLANTNTYNRDIYLVYGTNTGGPGIISGNVLQGANKPSRNGAPMDGMSLILLDANNNTPVAYTKATIGGSYSFQNIPLGNYKVYGEWLNNTSIPANITLSASNTSASNVNFEVNTNVINPTFSFPATTEDLTPTPDFFCYPNPASERFTLRSATLDMDVTIKEITGRTILRAQVKSGEEYEINCQSWTKGIYLIEMRSGVLRSSKKLMIE
ncbi:MAG: PKD domain-containing protein [Chitinophagaceae bacterium]|nr:PKD domain-containing protein [Chitinophagaceae bacterium]